AGLQSFNFTSRSAVAGRLQIRNGPEREQIYRPPNIPAVILDDPASHLRVRLPPLSRTGGFCLSDDGFPVGRRSMRSSLMRAGVWRAPSPTGVCPLHAGDS